MDKKIEKLLITHANINKDEECCGFIALNNIKQLIIIPCENIYEFPESGFKVCAHEFLKIKQKYEIVCLYHSHPVGPAKFSKKDLAMGLKQFKILRRAFDLDKELNKLMKRKKK